MFEKFKKFLAHSLIAVITAGSVLVGGSALAGLGSGITNPVYFYLEGNNLLPQDSSWEIGSNSNRIAKIWAIDGDFTNMVIGSVTNGCLTVGGAATTTICGDTTTSTFGSAIDVAGMVSSTGMYSGGDFTLVGDFIMNGDADITGDVILRGDLDMNTGFYKIKVRSVLSEFPGSIRNITAAGPSASDVERFDNLWIRGSGGNVTITATPSIDTDSSYNGKVMCFQGDNDSQTVTFQDNDNLAGSLLETNGNMDITLGQYDLVCFKYLLARNRWMQYTPFMDN